MGDPSTRSPWLVAAALTAALAVRVALWLFFWPVGLHDDERDYHSLAVNLVHHGEFAYDPGRPISIRPPLYPLLLAGVYSLTGECYPAVRLVQLVLSLATALVIYGLGAAVYDRRIGLVASLLFLFYPSFLGFNNLLYTETLFTFLLCAGCYLLIRAVQGPSLVWLLPAGAVLGLAALTRSVVWLLPPLLWVYFLLAWRGGWGQRLLAAVLFTVPFVATLAPWSLRNSRLEQTFVVVDTMGGRNFMMGNYEHTPLFRAWDAIGVTGEQGWYEVLCRADPSALQTTQGQRDKLALRYGLRYALDHPLQTAQRDAIKFFNFWGLERELIGSAAQGYYGWLPGPVIWLLALVVFGSYAVLFLLGVLGIVLIPPVEWRSHALLLLVILFVCAMHTLVFGHSRYHLPLIPLLMAYAASALVRFRELSSLRTRPRFWFAVGLAVLFVAAWTAEITVVYADRFARLLGGT